MNITATHWKKAFAGNYHHVAIIDSTQTYINQIPPHAIPIFCRADHQYNGHGQHGRNWHSPQGNLYCSLRWPMNLPCAAQAGLAQQVALSIAEALDPSAETLRLKWPNDLFTPQGKCGGILIDLCEHRGKALVTIGIGLNLTRQQQQYGALGDDLNPCYHDIDTTLNTIMPPLLATLQYWFDQPYLPIGNRWQEYDRYYGQTLTLEGHAHPVTLFGIDQKGALIARDQDGLHTLTQVRIPTRP